MLKVLADLIEGGYVGQAIIATGLVAGMLWEVVHSQPVDSVLTGFLGAVIGFYFRGVLASVRSKDST